MSIYHGLYTAKRLFLYFTMMPAAIKEAAAYFLPDSHRNMDMRGYVRPPCLQRKGKYLVTALVLMLLLSRCMGIKKQDGARFLHNITAPQSVMLQVNTPAGLQQMDMEQYLLGVVAAEMPAAFAEDALAAQAVAARTYALRKLLRGGCSRGGDVCTDAGHCQAWCSDADMRQLWDTSYDMYYGKIAAAVNKTAGQVLCYDGQVIEALFHSSSGGATEACAAVFSQNLPYLQSVSSPEEVRTHTVTYTAAEVCKRLADAVGETGLTPSSLAEGLYIAAYTPSGRVQTLQAGSKQLSGAQARAAFSLRSTDFTVSVAGDTVTFTAAGYGHGVGMSQYGAHALAQAGEDWQSILAHYYPGTALQSAAGVLRQ